MLCLCYVVRIDSITFNYEKKNLLLLCINVGPLYPN